MPAIAVGAAIVGAGISTYGAIKSASDQADLDNARARIADQQAEEIQQRELANESLRDQQAYRQKLQFASSYAASGKAGVGIGSQLQIQSQSDLQSMMSNREAKFQAFMLHQQAGIDTTMANDVIEAGNLNAAGAAVSGLGAAARGGMSGGSSPGYGGTQALGAMPTFQQLQMPALGSSSGYNGGGG